MYTYITLLAVPVGALAFLTVVGAGAAVALAPRFPPDAQAALAPVAGAALIAVASVLLPFGTPVRPLAVAVALLGLALTVRYARRGWRSAALPLLVAVGAVAIAGAPALARGDWEATSLYGSTDAYHWASQARAYLDGPADPPVAEHPDRLTYERSKTQHWAVALPFGLLQVAWLSGSEPPEVYGAFSALLFCLLPLATYACARGCLEWRPAQAAAAALALALNAALLFASHFSWQQQVAGTAFAFAAAATLRLALEPGAHRRELLLPALLTAAALATYRLGFAPYLAALLAAVVVAFAWVSRDRARVARAAAAFAGLAALVAAPSLAALTRGLPEFVSSGGFSTAFKRAFPDGQPAEGLGLVPRVWALKEDWPAAAELSWLAVATVAAVVLLVAGWRAARRSPRPDLLAAGLVLSLGGWLLLLLPVFSSYLSYKVLSYGAPFLVLAALAGGRAAMAAVGCLAAPAAVAATIAAVDSARTPPEVEARPLPAEAVVAVEVEDPWEQAWALYYLREQTLSVAHPSFILTAQGRTRAPEAYRNGPVTYRLVARGDELRLVPVS